MRVQRPIPFLPLAGLLAALLAGCGADNAAGSTEPAAGARIAPAEVSSSASAEVGDDGFRAELNGEPYRASLHNACLVTREGRERVPSLRMTFNQGKDAVQIVVPLVDGTAGARPIAMAIVNRGKDSYVGLRGGGQAELSRLEQTADGYVVTGRFDVALRGVGSGAGMKVTDAAFADLECVDLGKTLGTRLGE